MSDLLGRKGGSDGEEEIQPVSGCLGCACSLCGGDWDFGCELGFSGPIRGAVPAKPDAAERCRRQAHRLNGGLLLLAGGLFHAVFRDGGGESILHVHARSALCRIRLLEDRRLERQHRNQLEWPVRAAVDHGWPVRLAGDVYVRGELRRLGGTNPGSTTVTVTAPGGGGPGSGGGSSCTENLTSQIHATFVSMSGVPASITAGGSFAASVTFQNTGACTWTAANGYRLGSQNPENNTTWGTSRGYSTASDAIAPGQSKTFTINAVAPSTAGTYGWGWRMVREGINWLGTPTNGSFTSISVTGSVPPQTGPPSVGSFAITPTGRGRMTRPQQPSGVATTRRAPALRLIQLRAVRGPGCRSAVRGRCSRHWAVTPTR